MILMFKVCDITEMKCQNEQCVLREYFCNGRNDCSDGSDEYNCGEMIRPAKSECKYTLYHIYL